MTRSNARRVRHDWRELLLLGLLLSVLGLLLHVRRAAAARPPSAQAISVTIGVQDAVQHAPIAAVEVRFYQQQTLVAAATTDADGRASLLLPEGAYISTLSGTLPDGTPLRPNPVYAAQGGIPLYVLQRSAEVWYSVDSAGWITPAVGPISISFESTGSAAALTVKPPLARPHMTAPLPLAAPPSAAITRPQAEQALPPDAARLLAPEVSTESSELSALLVVRALVSTGMLIGGAWWSWRCTRGREEG